MSAAYIGWIECESIRQQLVVIAQQLDVQQRRFYQFTVSGTEQINVKHVLFNNTQPSEPFSYYKFDKNKQLRGSQ
jgi:hypothetical protein